MESGPFMKVFSQEEVLRYSRQLNLRDVGEEGQRRLKNASVLCIGAGGLGSPAALYLAAAGAGTLGIVDNDVVDLSNLHRQLLHGTGDVGRKKADSARERLHGINPNIRINIHPTRLRADNAIDLISAYDIILDGSDNLSTRYLSSDVCVWQKKPNIYGSVHQFEGQLSVFAPHLGGPCYRCLFPDPPPADAIPSCAEAGVLGVVPGVIGVMQAMEAIKLILGIGESLVGRLLHIDTLSLRFREFKLRRDRDCPVCGEAPSIVEPIDYEQFCSARSDTKIAALSPIELNDRLKKDEKITLIDVREPFEFEIARLPNARLLPLGKIATDFNEIPREGTAVLICKSGVRSARAIEFLRGHGFDNLLNLEGGMDAWREQVDPTMVNY
jgi:sulfur-carrier protein adenylyltransferase/sulfurtransferase